MRERSVLFAWLVIALSFLATPARALDLEARVDRNEVGLDGRVTLTLVIEGGRGEAEIDLGRTAGFRVYSAGTSQSISIVNGAVTSSIVHSYLLSPTTEGNYSVGPFRVTLGGEAATAPAIAVRVTAGQAPGPSPPSGGGTGSRPGAAKGTPRDVFIRAFLDKKEAYVGEQITLTFRLYTRVRFAGDPGYTPPSTEGFWVEDLPPQRRFYDDVNGTNYLVNEVKSALFATRAGRLVVGPAKLQYEADSFFSSDPFDLLRGRMRGSRQRPVRETLATDSLVVDVKPLPTAGRPADFGGSVGSFRLGASMDKDSVTANEPVTLTVTLEGEGNIQAATLPDPVAPETFKVYDSGSSTETSKDNYVVRGKKTYTRVFVPRYGGEYGIAPIAFTFFDPRQNSYVRRTAGPFSIRVSGEPPAEESAQQTIERKEEDLRYLKEPADVGWNQAERGFPAAALAAGNAAPLLFLGALLLVRRRRDRFERDHAWARARRADGAAKSALREARARLGDEDSREFATAIGRGVTGYFGDRANLATWGMTAREVVHEIERRTGDANLAERTARFLAECDRARYAAAPMPPAERERLLDDAEELIRDLGRPRKGGRTE